MSERAKERPDARTARQRVIDALRCWYQAGPNAIPKISDYEAYVESHTTAPSLFEIYRAFGSFREACSAATLPYLPPGTEAEVTSFSDVENSLLLARKELGPVVTRDSYTQWAIKRRDSGKPVVTISEVRRFIATWEEAAEIGGFAPARRQRWVTRTPKTHRISAVNREAEIRELTEIVRQVCLEHGGRGVSSSEWKRASRGRADIPNQELIKEAFGSFPAAIKAASFEPAKPGRPRTRDASLPGSARVLEPALT